MLQPPAPFSSVPPTPVLPHFMQQPESPKPLLTPETGLPTDTQPQFGRMAEDGIPFRGPPTMLTEKEFESTTRVGAEFVSATFDTSNDEQNKRMLELAMRIRRENGTVLSFRQRWHTPENGKPGMIVYMLVEFSYRELDPSKPRGRELLARRGELDKMRREANHGHIY